MEAWLGRLVTICRHLATDARGREVLHPRPYIIVCSPGGMGMHKLRSPASGAPASNLGGILALGMRRLRWLAVFDLSRQLALCDWLLRRNRLTEASVLASLVRRFAPQEGRFHLRAADAALAAGNDRLAHRLLDRLAVPRDNVPPGAGLLLEVIGAIEAPRGYGTIYGNRQHELATPLTRMTLAEVQGAQPFWATVNGSSAAGRYQVIDRTLATVAADLALDPNAPFDTRMQDRIGYALLARRGFDRFMSGDLPRADFAIELAREWAAFPVLSPVRGEHRLLEAGETWYAGDGRNRALVSPALFIAVLHRCRDPALGAGHPTAR